MKNIPATFLLPALLALAAAASAQAGFTDPTFGQNGVVKTNIGYDDSANAVLVQPDKKIVVGVTTRTAGDTNKVTLVRYLENGALDAGFGSGGKSSYPLAPGHDECAAILLQSDGRIVVIGSNLKVFTSSFEFDFFAARFLPDGQLDTSFGGGNGYVLTDHDYRDFAVSGILRPDGKIVLLGNSDTPDPNMIVAQYLPDGSVDPSFGAQGVQVLNFGFEEVATALALQPDGKMILCGYRYYILSNDDVWLARLLPNGAVDPAFGTAGMAVYVKPDRQRAWDCERMSNGDILAAGYSWNLQEEDFLALRFKPNGVPDAQFGNQGEALVSFQQQKLESAGDVLVAPDGKIILVGNAASEQNETEFALAGLTPNGVLDTTFGNGGKIISAIGPYTDYPLSAALAPDGKIVAAGYAELKDTLFNAPYDAVVARFLGTGNVSAQSPDGSAIALEAYPNPVSDGFVVSYELLENERLHLDLLDQSGQTMQTFFSNAFRPAGQHDERLGIAPNLPGGTYVLLLRSSNFQRALNLQYSKE